LLTTACSSGTSLLVLTQRKHRLGTILDGYGVQRLQPGQLGLHKVQVGELAPR
jgi:hypothetical protein